ncbi:hypothetical protein [Parasutterella sp.]
MDFLQSGKDTMSPRRAGSVQRFIGLAKRRTAPELPWLCQVC